MEKETGALVLSASRERVTGLGYQYKRQSGYSSTGPVSNMFLNPCNGPILLKSGPGFETSCWTTIAGISMVYLNYDVFLLETFASAPSFKRKAIGKLKRQILCKMSALPLGTEVT